MTETNLSKQEKTVEQFFADWESHVFGYGYGTGEEHVLKALKEFLTICVRGEFKRAYNHEELAETVTPTVAWLLINALCHADIIEYGTSPRYGWLTDQGIALRDFMVSRSVSDLEAATGSYYDDAPCFPDHCNCGSNCHFRNPFWKPRR